jgi:hypothetical protein
MVVAAAVDSTAAAAEAVQSQVQHSFHTQRKERRGRGGAVVKEKKEKEWRGL